ncbi:MAG: hypothetical protein RRY54_04165, partial [Angelakisella sp.]
MKKLMSIFLSVAMLTALTTQIAFAAPPEEVADVEAGQEFTITTFYDASDVAQSNYWSTDNYTLSTPSFSKGRNYVEKTYIDDSAYGVVIRIKSGMMIDSATPIVGTIKIREKGVSSPKTYTAKVNLTLQPMQRLLLDGSDGDFYLPGMYNSGMLRFITSEGGEKEGTLHADFTEDSSTIARFTVKIYNQSPLNLHHNSDADISLMKKHEN